MLFQFKEKRKGVSDGEEVKEADKFTKVHIDKFYPSQAVLFDVFKDK